MKLAQSYTERIRPEKATRPTSGNVCSVHSTVLRMAKSEPNRDEEISWLDLPGTGKNERVRFRDSVLKLLPIVISASDQSVVRVSLSFFALYGHASQ